MMQTAARRAASPGIASLRFSRRAIVAGSGGRFLALPAIINQEGFRDDGSYRYGPGRLQDSEKNITADFWLTLCRELRQLIADQMLVLERLAALARTRGVTLVGIQLPFAKAGVDILDNNESYHHYSGFGVNFKAAQ